MNAIKVRGKAYARFPHMSDRIAVMNHGRIEQIGPSDELYENPRTRFVADFIGETNLMAGKVEALDRETVRVASGALTLFGRRPAEIGPGDAVHVSIRPEKIRSGDECGNCETTTKGVIVDVVYKGSEIRYELRLGDGSRLTYDEQTKHHSRRFEIAPFALRNQVCVDQWTVGSVFEPSDVVQPFSIVGLRFVHAVCADLAGAQEWLTPHPSRRLPDIDRSAGTSWSRSRR